MARRLKEHYKLNHLYRQQQKFTQVLQMSNVLPNKNYFTNMQHSVANVKGDRIIAFSSAT